MEYEYRTIRLRRSVISIDHSTAHVAKVVVFAQVSDLIKGVFISRHPQLKHTFIWDVQTVLDYVKENRPNNKTIPDKELSFKQTILVVLTTASRVSGIHHLNLKNMALLRGQYNLASSSLLKG